MISALSNFTEHCPDSEAEYVTAETARGPTVSDPPRKEEKAQPILVVFCFLRGLSWLAWLVALPLTSKKNETSEDKHDTCG